MASKKVDKNPLLRIAAKGRPEPEHVDQISLIVLLALDAAKRGQATIALSNTLTEHLMVGVLLWARQGNRALYDVASAAWLAMGKACKRAPETGGVQDLTTSEYTAIRKAIRFYLLAIPQMEVGTLVGAFEEAKQKLWGKA